jgi:hypothetical protein
MSLEDPDWGEHGIFSHFLSVGLRGEGDLDGDGVVSLAELVQYVTNRVQGQARAVIEDLQRSEAPHPTQSGQHPVLICGGPAGIPVTRRMEEGRAEFETGIFHLWRRYLAHSLPYHVTVETMVRYGTALLYGGTTAATVLMFAPSPFASRWLVIAMLAFLISGAVWLSGVALAGAANERRWHTGGYVSSLIALAWHVVLGTVLLLLLPRWAPDASPLTAGLGLTIDLFVLISIMVIFGYNALQCIISLADLVKREERVVLRRIFRQLDERWIHADVPNVIAMVSAHPRLYQLVGLICCLLALAHGGYTLFVSPLDAHAATAILRDALLIVLIQWQVQWYAAAYRVLTGDLLPER